MRNRKPPDEKTPQGTPAQSGQGEGGEPKYVTEEQLNRAISARLGDFGKKIEKSISESLATTLTAKLDELKASITAPGTGDGTSKDPPKGGDVENSPLVKGLQKQLDDQKAAVLAMKNERDAEKARSRDQVLRTKLSEDLTRGGIDPTRVRQAVGILVDVEKRVRFADDEGDELVFKDTTGDVDLATGLKGWLKSDDAKIFLPPRGTQGSGDRSQGKATQNGQQQPSVGATLLGMALGMPPDRSQG
jgi:hypothetical protein